MRMSPVISFWCVFALGVVFRCPLRMNRRLTWWKSALGAEIRWLWQVWALRQYDFVFALTSCGLKARWLKTGFQGFCNLMVL